MRAFTVREAIPRDAVGYIRLIKGVLREQPPVDTPYAPEEFDPPPEAMAARIEDVRESDNSCFLVAEAEGEIIGALTCGGGSLQADAHMTTLGVYVAKPWRDRGVGTALMEKAVAWARSGDVVERIELEVYSGNARAIHLYRKYGFEEEGRKRRVYYRHGQAMDMLIMALLITR